MSHRIWHRASPALVGHEHEHAHSHGLVDPSIIRSRAGVNAVLLSLGVLGVTAAVQAVIFVLSGSVALLADLIHNAGDALTAIPVGAAFLLRSERAEKWAGYAVVLTIFISGCVALYETIAKNGSHRSEAIKHARQRIEGRLLRGA